VDVPVLITEQRRHL